MNLTPAGRVDQSLDGTKLIYNDLSNWTGNSNNQSIADYVRTVQVKDANGVLLATIPFSLNALTVEYDITVDKWLSFTYTAVKGSLSPLTKIVNFYSKRFYQIAQAAIKAGEKVDCNCDLYNGLCTDLSKARESIEAAQTFYDIGDSINCQAMLDAADDLLINNVTTC